MTTPTGTFNMRGFIASRSWREAKTYAETIPHSYTVRKGAGDLEFEEAAAFIRQHGAPRRFGRRNFVYLELDGWEFWTMGAPLGDTTILNRQSVAQRAALIEKGLR